MHVKHVPLVALLLMAHVSALQAATTDESGTAVAPPHSVSEDAAPTLPGPPAVDGEVADAAAEDAATETAEDGATESTPAVDFQVTGGLQIEAGEFAEAVTTLSEGIAQLERTLPRYDLGLAKPLTLLGDAQFGNDDYAAAQETYARAIHITRVNDGLHSAEQVPIVYREAEAMAAQGNVDDANARQEYAYETLRRAYGPTSESLVPGMYALAAWYKRTHNIYSARELYAQASDILARIHGPDSPELLLPLRGVAETYRQERFPPYITPKKRETVSLGTGSAMPIYTAEKPLLVNRYSDGERALGQIIRILNDDPESSRLDAVLAVLDLADWHMLFEKYDRAFELYGRVQSLLVTDAGLAPEELDRYFGQPMPLYLPMPDNPAAPPAALRNRRTEGYVDLGYTVTERGNVTRLETLGAEPPGLMDVKVRRAMRIARFRPRFVDGEPVATDRLKYRHRFLYYPKPAEPEPETEDAPEDAAMAEEPKAPA